MGPLSAKQHREYLKLNSQEQRESAKMEQDERRKQQLHEIKLQEAAAKANQGIGHKEQMQQVKLKEAAAPLTKPSTFVAKGTDTVPAMLTPGEAVIPEPAAQNPKNKAAIASMVEEGRQANALRDGAVQITPRSLAYEHPDVPGSSFMDGTEKVFSRGSSDQANYSNGTYGVVPQQVQQAAGYEDGATNVSWLDKLLGNISGQPVPQVVAPVATQPTYTSSKEIPAVSGVAEPFQQWKNATMGVESNYGNHPKTWEKNNAGAMGLYGLTENTFEGMKKQGMIPKEWKHTDQTQNTQASEVLANDTWKRAGGDPAKASAIWYSGPKAVDAKTGQIKSFKDPKNPEFPDTLKYVDNVKGILSRSDATTKDFVPRDIPYNKNAYSMQFGDNGTDDQGVVNAGLVKPTSIPYTATVTPVAVPAMMPQQQQDDLKRSQELAKDSSLSANDRAFFEQETKRLSGQPSVAVGATEPKELLRQVTGSNVIGNKIAPVPPTELPIAEVIPEPEVKPSLIQTKPEEANKAIATVSQEKADIIKQFVDTAPTVSKEPEEQKSWLAKQIANVFSPTGLFSDTELMRFAIVAAGGMLTGGSTGGSLRYAGLDALKSGDARRQAQAVAAQESLKNTRELIEKLDSDYRTALGENVPAAIRTRAIELRAGADNPDKLRSVIQLLKSHKSSEDTTGAGKPGVPGQGFLNGKPVNYRSHAGNIETVNDKGEWAALPPAQLKGFETADQRRTNVSDMHTANVERLTPVLKQAFGADKNYNAETEAKRLSQAFALIKDDIGPNISASSFAKMSENTIRSAIDSAKASGTALTEEGLRKAFFGNAAIETRMLTNNKDFYMVPSAKKKGEMELPSAPYQVALGTAMEKYRKEGMTLGEGSQALETKWKSLPDATKKKFTDMSKGAPGSTPMLFWLQQTGGTN